jgi:hypothetical protein
MRNNFLLEKLEFSMAITVLLVASVGVRHNLCHVGMGAVVHGQVQRVTRTIKFTPTIGAMGPPAHP